MLVSQIFLGLACAAVSSSFAIVFLYRYANDLGLVDRPNERKKHVGNIPVIGGLCAFAGVLAGVAVAGQSQSFVNYLLGTTAVLVMLGAIDDRTELRVWPRLLVQAAAVVTVAVGTGVHIHTLGHLFGMDIDLGVFGIPFTVIAVIGLMNAFNMMDGIDGLAGSLALTTVVAIAVYQGSQWRDLTLLLLMAGALLPYLASNLGLVGRKIFLGDAGSLMVGYVLAWTLIALSQSNPSRMTTVDVIWCVALPVLDTLAVMVRRLREGKSPFKPDRGHIHHLMLNAGLTPRMTLLILVAFALALAGLGTFTRQFAPGSNLLAFGALTLIYIAAHRRIWLSQQSASRASAIPAPTGYFFIERRVSRPAGAQAGASIHRRRRGDQRPRQNAAQQRDSAQA